MRTAHPRPRIKCCLISVALLLGLAATPGRRVAPPVFAQSPEIKPGAPIEGNISDDAPSQDWRFVARAGQQFSILVDRLGGDLDPTVTVLASDDNVVAENDDRVPSLVLDAGLEGVIFEEAGPYTIRVGRQTGTGDYRLWLAPGYRQEWEAEDFDGDASRWVGRYAAQEVGRLRLEAGAEFSIFVSARGAIPLDDFYVQAEFEWLSNRDDVAATTGLILRAADDGTRRPPGYYFLITPDGTWTVLLRSGDEFSVLQPATPSALLTAERVTLGAWLEGSTLRFYANGELLGELQDETFAEGVWGFQVRGAQLQAAVAVRRALLTVPERRLPQTPMRLETWRSSQPAEIAAELQRLRLVPPDGSRVLTVETQSFEVGPQGARAFLQGEDDDLFSDMLLGVDVRLLAGDNVGCGIALRYLDAANQTLAYVDSDGGAGLIHTRNGILERNAYDLLPPADDPLPQDRIRLLVLARRDVVTLYVNGRWFSSEWIPPTAGRLAVLFLNYSTTPATCAFNDLWVWESP